MSRCIDEGGIVHGIKCPRCGTTNSVLGHVLTSCCISPSTNQVSVLR